MTGTFKDHFSEVAAGYQAFRPGYPPALFGWLASIASRRELAVDLGCGSGQASVALAGHFAEVIGVDPSAEQVARAEPHRGVRYRVAPAEATGLAAGSADLAIAAQAYHWFDPEPFQREVARILAPGAPFAAFTYGLCQVAPEVDAVVERLYRGILGPWWPKERAHVDAGYRSLSFPWPEIEAPGFSIEEEWTLDRFLGYLRTWSAASAYQRQTGADAVELVAGPLSPAWGPPGRTRRVAWSLAVRAGRVGGVVALP